MNNRSVRLLYAVFFIFVALFLIAAVSNNNAINNFIKKDLGLKILYVRLFFFPLFFLAFIAFQKIKGKTWPSLKNDIIYGSLFTVISAAIYFLFAV